MNAGLFVVAQAFNRPVFSFNSWNLCCKDLLKFPKVDLPSIYYLNQIISSFADPFLIVRVLSAIIILFLGLLHSVLNSVLIFQ